MSRRPPHQSRVVQPTDFPARHPEQVGQHFVGVRPGPGLVRRAGGLPAWRRGQTLEAVDPARLGG